MGADAKSGAKVKYKKSEVRDIKVPIGFVGDGSPLNGTRGPNAKVTLRSPQTIKPAGYLDILWFGKRHYISPALFARDADKYQQLHWKDAWLNLDMIRNNESVFWEWTHPSGFMERITSDTTFWLQDKMDSIKAYWKEGFKKIPRPDTEEFDKLGDRIRTSRG